MNIAKRVVLHFPRSLVDQPVICRLAKDFSLEFNILKASVTPKEEGLMVLELSGERENYERGLKYIAETGVEIQPLSQNVTRNEERCTHCGACVVICPTGALSLEPETRQVSFDDGKCIACELCVLACPLRAMEVHL